MKLRGLLLIALGGLAVLLALAVFVRGGVSTICPAVGYAYTADVELVFAHEPTSVAACFGEGCTPAAVTRNPDGRWLVSQSAPYLMPPVDVTSVFVDAVDSSGVRVARMLPIETEPTGEHPDGAQNDSFLPSDEGILYRALRAPSAFGEGVNKAGGSPII